MLDLCAAIRSTGSRPKWILLRLIPRGPKTPVKGREYRLRPQTISMTIPEGLPITETELRALEILLGTDLKELLAGTTFESLK